MKVTLYDATLREGAQGAGASFSLEDKVRIVHLLDELGVPYIEAGNPGSNPKDAEFYARMRNIHLKNSRLAAFGATCRVGADPEQDGNLQALLSAETPVITLFGKSWDFHVTHVLHAELAQNVDIIAKSIRYFTDRGREVCFDAEHFFDGYKHNPDYALQVLTAARQAGARWLCLCDTNGGCFPHEVADITRRCVELFGDAVGIHAHNDTGMAEANTTQAILQGAGMAQVTANGLGERCGNADLFTTVPNLQLKLGHPCLPQDSLAALRSTSLAISELCNQQPDARKPYVGAQAFTHKAGMHIDGVSKHPTTFEHVPPDSVGNERTFVLSEIAGRAAVLAKIQKVLPDIDKGAPEVALMVERLKHMEFEGYQFEGADASFELEVRRMLRPFPPLFELKNFKVIVTEPAHDGDIATAMIEVLVGGVSEITAANGNGPVNALDAAARKALEHFYPQLRSMFLSDYKVRVLDSGKATASRVRVLVESQDESDHWTTVGVSGDVIGASWIALTDSLEYKLLKDKLKGEQ